eukprot:PLAT4593.2.p1 GENE.PLAT4593.2~~PLAT4593.2.p1  ORF type:complete len:458 (+),score=102.74 PLAT4593.2:579-1952(+)
MSLSSACSWLRSTVLRNIRFIELKSSPTAFPAARFSCLRHVEASRGVEPADLLAALRACPQLRKLKVFGGSKKDDEAIAEQLPLLAGLQSVYLPDTAVNGQLGEALAACEALREVRLPGVRFSQQRTREPKSASAFLRQLTAVPALRSLTRLELAEVDDVIQLCAAVGAWTDLEELDVCSKKSPVDGIAVAVSESCPRMRKLMLTYVGFAPAPLLVEDMAAIGRMAELRELALAGPLSAAHISPLSALTKLEKLSLWASRIDEDAAAEFAAVVARLPLKEMQLRIRLSVAAMLPVLRAITANDRLTEVLLDVPRRECIGAQEELGVALAEAVLSSAVRHWNICFPFCFASFLRSWDGRAPAAALHTLFFFSVHSAACLGEEYAALLLRCVRSCASLRAVCVAPWHCRVPEVVAAVLAAPLLPTRMRLFVHEADVDAYEDRVDELDAAGLELQDGDIF